MLLIFKAFDLVSLASFLICECKGTEFSHSDQMFCEVFFEEKFKRKVVFACKSLDYTQLCARKFFEDFSRVLVGNAEILAKL